MPADPKLNEESADEKMQTAAVGYEPRIVTVEVSPEILVVDLVLHLRHGLAEFHLDMSYYMNFLPPSIMPFCGYRARRWGTSPDPSRSSVRQSFL